MIPNPPIWRYPKRPSKLARAIRQAFTVDPLLPGRPERVAQAIAGVAIVLGLLGFILGLRP